MNTIKSGPAESKMALSRRSLLKGAAMAGGALAMPAIINSKVLASSGEINILMWSDYLPETFLKSFTDATGITVNYTGIGSNEEIINKMKATKGRGFDIVSPTNNRSLQWQPLELLQPFDMTKVSLETVNPSMAKIGSTVWAFEDGATYWLPHIWGTEGMAWRTDLFTPVRAVHGLGLL